MPQEATSKNLLYHFHHTLNSSETITNNLGQQMWRLVVAHPWYQLQLKSISRWVAHGQTGNFSIEDLQQEAILLLARTFQRHPDLRFDSNQTPAHFARWMRKIIRRDCLQALRKLRRTSRETGLNETCWMMETPFPPEWMVSLKEGLDLLPRQEQYVVQHFLLGHSLRETAEILGIGSTTAHRYFQSAISLLRQSLCISK